MALTPYQQKVIADGASNYWPLNETSGTTAVDIIGGKNGTISGGVTLNQPGIGGSTAMTFDGTSGKIDTAATVSVLTPYTVELWYNVTAIAAANVPFFSTRHGYPTLNIIQLKLQPVNGFPSVVLDYANATSPEQVFSSGINRADGQWHCFVMVQTALNVDIYTDGAFVPPAHSLPATFAGATLPVRIASDLFDGFGACRLQNIAIYPLALTPAQIAAHYATAFASLGAPIRTRVDRPFNRYTAIVTSDTVNLIEPTLALYVGTAGDVVAVEQDGLVRTFAGVPAGSVLVVKAVRVMATGTTAGAIVALNRV